MCGRYVMPRVVLRRIGCQFLGPPASGSEGAASQPSWSWMFRTCARSKQDPYKPQGHIYQSFLLLSRPNSCTPWQK